ncbi:Rv3235 family protein [Dietzia sp. PP-33]|uniref:Rv3235 family protein n=1 Tax=Dietzia sp. PP-33 TaxID=2957500 RepID=UPI0029B82934|nr:Rv3235 family protein [Dietzia sp. PP-33]MDX2356670.1 Rv3235 family protein [Dietzia sp. PP-33]
MTPTPVSHPSAGGIASIRETSPDEYRVRPLPSTEPGPGPAGHEVGCPPVRAPAPTPEDAVPVPARRAAHALVIMALEVVDRKRAPHHTRGAFAPHLVEMLRALARGGVPGQHLGPARVHRLHIHAAGAGPGAPACGSPDADTGTGGSGRTRSEATADYEVCATYARGPRLFAVAARIRVSETGATCTALRLV